MKHLHKNILAGAVLIPLLGLVFMGFRWWALRPYVYQTTGPISRDEAIKQHCPAYLSLPASAHDIQFASYYERASSHFLQLMRFEAPYPDCYAFFKIVTFRSGFQPASHPMPPKENGCLQTDWFYVDRISKGIVGGNGSDRQPKAWVDEERGIFYYYLAD